MELCFRWMADSLCDQKRKDMMLKQNSENINPEDGLPEDLFTEISGLVPIPNVDLFILDDKGRLLLTRRDDRFFGKGWHLPGGCIRFKETMQERIQRTAQSELGTTVQFEKDPVAVRDVIIREQRPGLEDQNQRAHHLAVMYRCCPDDTEYIESLVSAGEAGWFEKIPEDILPVHAVFNDIFKKYGLM